VEGLRRPHLLIEAQPVGLSRRSGAVQPNRHYQSDSGREQRRRQVPRELTASARARGGSCGKGQWPL